MSLKRARIFLMLAVLVFLTPLISVRAQYQVESWTTDNGLPQNTVPSIVQTPDGYLWLATLDGLVRFDGVSFKVFNKSNTPGLEGNRFTQMLSVGNDLWIGTEEKGVVRYHDGVFQTFAIPENVLNKPIRNIILNSAGEITVLTTLDAFRWNGEKFVSYVPNSSIGETRENLALWDKAGGFQYVYSTDLPSFKGKLLSDYLSHYSSVIGPIENIQFNRLLEDKRGRLWFGTKDSGLLMLDNNKLTVYNTQNGMPSNQMKPMMTDHYGNLWAISSGHGAVIIDREGKINILNTEKGLNDDTLTTIYEDNEGNIWLGSLYRGLSRLSRQSVAFYSTKDGLAHDVVRVVYQTQAGNIWLGGAKLTTWQNNKFTPIIADENNLMRNGFTAMTEDHTGRLWFGYWNGVYYYENGKNTDFNDKLGSRTAVSAIYEDQAGNMWFGADSGVYRYHDGVITRFTTADGLAGSSVKIIHESPDGTLWFGTYGGLSSFKDGAFSKPLTTDDGLSSNQIRSIYEDAEGILWVGSYDGGLVRLKDGKITRYTSNDGLFNDGVFQILEDDNGNLWMSCNVGIYRVAKQQLNDFADGKISRISSTSYGKADGLLETECNGGQQPAGIKASDGRLWFPTQKGVAIIDPNAIESNPHPPPVLVQTFSLDRNDPVNISSSSSEIEVLPSVENLEIAYTALSFIKPEQIHFRYKMEGLDRDWIEAGSRRTAYYPHLPPGEYTFKVIAANSDGVWNNKGASIVVRVVPPFYRTWWFFVLSLTLGVLVIYLLYRRRIVRIKQAHYEQEEFSRKLFASQEQERQRISAELHDSIGQSLLIIKNRAFLAINDLENREIVREQLEELTESASGAIEECREISYNLRPYRINRFGLTKTLTAIFQHISEVSTTETIIETDSIDDLFSPEEEINIYRAVQESVNNIIKHSQATEAKFIIKRCEANVELLIQDDGRGFDANIVKSNHDGHGGFGLISIPERVRMLGGECEIESQPGYGTRIKITLKILSDNERNEHHYRRRSSDFSWWTKRRY